MEFPDTEVPKEYNVFVIKDILTTEDERTTFLLNVRIHIPSDAILYPRRRKSSDTLMQKNQNFKTCVCVCVYIYTFNFWRLTGVIIHEICGMY